MVSLRRSVDGEREEELAIESAAAHSRGGGRIAAIISAVALALSVYSLWETTLHVAARAGGRRQRRERELRCYDARAFTDGTLPMYAKDWRWTGGRRCRERKNEAQRREAMIASLGVPAPA
jgi:hypothetical protein